MGVTNSYSCFAGQETGSLNCSFVQSFTAHLVAEGQKSCDFKAHVGLPELVNKNTGCPVTLEFQVNNEYIFTTGMSQLHIWDTLTLKSYLEVKLNWVLVFYIRQR